MHKYFRVQRIGEMYPYLGLTVRYNPEPSFRRRSLIFRATERAGRRALATDAEAARVEVSVLFPACSDTAFYIALVVRRPGTGFARREQQRRSRYHDNQ